MCLYRKRRLPLHLWVNIPCACVADGAGRGSSLQTGVRLGEGVSSPAIFQVGLYLQSGWCQVTSSSCPRLTALSSWCHTLAEWFFCVYFSRKRSQLVLSFVVLLPPLRRRGRLESSLWKLLLINSERERERKVINGDARLISWGEVSVWIYSNAHLTLLLCCLAYNSSTYLVLIYKCTLFQIK